jgi:hypothetical protein
VYFHPKHAYLFIPYGSWHTLRIHGSIRQLPLLLLFLLVRPDWLRERLLAKLQQCRMTICGQDVMWLANVLGGQAMFTLVGLIVKGEEKDETIISPFGNLEGLMGQITPTKKQGCCSSFRPETCFGFTDDDAEATPHDIISAYMK